MKKGQLQIQETIFVIFIFLLILVIGMVVYYSYELKSIKSIKTENDRNTFYYMLSYIPSMSELRCSEFGYDDECIDYTKAKSFSYLNNNYYQNVFSFKKIILIVGNEEVKLYDWNPNNYLAEKITSPVSVYNPLTKTYSIGILEVYMYAE